jgi:hypothetical protein
MQETYYNIEDSSFCFKVSLGSINGISDKDFENQTGGYRK